MRAPDGREVNAVFRVSAPIEQAGGGWGAAVGLLPLEPERTIYGEDGWQAVRLGMNFLVQRAEDYSQRGWRFYWQSGEEAGVDELNL